MKIGIKYCGGCNPHIDRSLLTRHLEKKLISETCAFEFFNFDDCEATLVINGCSTGCAEVPKGKNIIVVSGLEIDGEQFNEENLPCEIIRRLKPPA